MIQTEVLIIGGGPAGSACAWRLKQANVDCIILDQHTFPRSKPCAGWITPDVLKDLSFTPKDYQYGLTTFHSFQVSLRCLTFKLPTLQYAVRRCEFDYWMLRRSGAAFQQHKVKSIERFTDGYVVDSMFSTRYLVGAGGTYCPVYRSIFKTISPKSRQSLIVAQVEEFPYAYTDERCRLWFFEDRLPGYSWYVPKANGYVNVGVGGKAERFNVNNDSLKNHWNRLVEKLDRLGLVRGHDYRPKAHSYYVRQDLPEIRKGNAFLVGDSAGLATIDMGEGISPAIKSGLKVAEAILKGNRYNLNSISRYSMRSILNPT